MTTQLNGGLVSQETSDPLNEREVVYVVGTPRHQLDEFERELLRGEWQRVAVRSVGGAPIPSGDHDRVKRAPAG